MENRTLKQIKIVAGNLLLITVGSLLCAVAINGILVPKQFLAGGITGLCLLLHFFIPGLSVGLLYFIINIHGIAKTDKLADAIISQGRPVQKGRSKSA